MQLTNGHLQSGCLGITNVSPGRAFNIGTNTSYNNKRTIFILPFKEPHCDSGYTFPPIPL